MAVGAVHGVLIGRDQEMARLGDWISELSAGRGRAVSIEGEPGIGKSALIRAAAAEGVGLGCRVLWGGADELGQAFPLQPLIDALATNEPHRSDVLAVLRSGPGSPLGGRDVVAAASERMLAVIDDLCATSPIMLVIDDLQWADDATIGVWERLAQAARQLPLLLVATVRSVPHRDEMAAVRAAAGPAGTIVLNALDQAAIRQVIATLCGAAPATALLDLAAGAAGNPLYLIELLDALDRSGSLHVTPDGRADITEGPFPATLSEAITDRLRFLAAPAREVVRTAALLGPEFTVDELAIVRGAPVGDLLPALHEAAVAGVLVERGPTLAFRHPLIRAALYHEEPAPIRAAWHRSAAHALATAGAPPERVARQLLPTLTMTSNAVIDEWMLDWLVHSAQLLIGQSPEVAVDLLKRAVPATQPGDRHRSLLNCGLAEALRRAGHIAEARQTAQQALEHTDDPGLVVELCEILTMAMAATGHYDDCAPIIEDALTRPGLSGHHGDMLRIIHARLGMYRSRDGAEEALRVSTAALARAEPDDLRVRSWALITSADMHGMLGRVDQAMATYDTAFEVMAADPALADVTLQAQGNRALMLIAHDRIAEGAVAAEEVRQAAETSGNPLRLNLAIRGLVVALFMSGRWDDALLELDALHTNGPPEIRIQAHAMASIIALHRGMAEVADAELAAAREINEQTVPASSVWLVVRILRHELDGTMDQAISLIIAALPDDGDGYWQFEDWLADGVRAAVMVGETALAATITNVAQKIADTSGVPNHQAIASHCRGLLDRDPELLLRAAEGYEQVGRVLPRSQALEAAALALIERGDAAGARHAYTAAIELYIMLDASWDLARLSAELRAHGIRRGQTGPRQRPSHGWESLTPTESRVAALVAQGLSNPQIAEQLFLSRRTVQTHVAHILNKLDQHSRVDIARETVRRREPSPPTRAE